MNAINVIYVIGAFQALLFTLLLVAKKKKKKADKFLAGFFFAMTIYFSKILSYLFGLWQQWPDILFVSILVPLIYGPLLYFYVLSLIQRPFTRKQLLLHLIPIVVIYLVILPFAFHSKEEKLLYFTDKFIKLPINVSIGTFLLYLSAPIYFIWIVLTLRKHKKMLRANASAADEKNMKWLRKLLLVVMTLWMIDSLNVYALNFTYFEIPYAISFYIKSLFICCVSLIGFYGLRVGNIFTPFQLEQTEEIASSKNEVLQLSEKTIEENIKALAECMQCEEDTQKRIQDIAMNLNIPVHVLSHITNVKVKKEECCKEEKKKKLLSDELAEEHTNTLVKYMQEKMPYLNSELRIQDISVDLNIPVHLLSHIINTKLDQNFFDFVNKYRIEEVKQRLHNPQYNCLTIVAIAFDCGFNSKATFNRLFKKYTGITPTQYKKVKQ